MAEEKTSEVKEIENCFDTDLQEMMSEEGSVRTVIIKDVGNVEDFISLALKGQEECVVSNNKHVPKPPCVSSRRHSIGAIGKPEVQSRYRGNHHVPSIHDRCKHGKLHDQRDAAVKPWKVARRTSVGGSEVVKVETTSGLRRASLGSTLMSRQILGTKPESCAVVKRDALAAKKKTCEDQDREMASSVDGSSVRSINDKARKKNKGTETALSGGVGGDGSSVVKKVLGLGSEKSKSVSRISDAESSNVYAPKSKEKAKAGQTISGEDVKEKTVCVVEASVIKGVQSEKQASSSEKKTMRSRLKSLTTPPTKQVHGTALITKKKESADAELVAKNIRPKKTGKVMTLEDASPRVVEELETQTEEKRKKKKKNLKKGVGETKSVSCEGSKREKVVLRRRKLEGKKTMVTLFNSVIEETVDKLIKVRKTKVKALIGAFETVITLQDTKTPQNNGATSESKVIPLGSKQ